MISDLISLLEKCTVRLLGTRGWQGTGFFVAPGIVLTCSHVVRLESVGSEDIIVEWKGQTFAGVLRLAVPNPYTDENPFPDVAIVDVRKAGSAERLDQHPCVLLDTECLIGDDLYAFGFPRGKPGGDSITAECEGESHYGSSPDLNLLKFKNAQVLGGASGSPLLNLRSRRVCGIVKRTRDDRSALGGLAVRIPTVFSHVPFLESAQRDFHNNNRDWINASSIPSAIQSEQHTTVQIAALNEPRGLSLQSLLESLPITTRKLFGRDEELAWLDQCYKNPRIRLVVLHAFGGVGKTALIRNWLETRFSNRATTTPKFIGCSFYSQGTRERAGTSDQFLYDSLKLLGDPEPTKGSLWARAKRLSNLLSNERTVTILDGLEPLQHGPGQNEDEGRLKDAGIRELLSNLIARPGQSFCLITTRLPLNESFVNSSCVQRSLDLLSDEASEQLLRDRGIRGTDRELHAAASYLGNHSLALVLAAEYLNSFCEGDAARVHEIPLINEDTKAGRHAKSVMEAYEGAFRRERDFLDLELLKIVGLFDRPAKWAWIKVLCSKPGLSGFEELGQASDEQLNKSFLRLQRLGLISEVISENKLDTHPLIAEYFGSRFRVENEAGWRQANSKLFEFLSSTSAAIPITLEEIEPLLLAVVHGCRAGKYAQALNDIFIARIMRREELYASAKLGLIGPLLTVLTHFFEGRDWTKPVQLSSRNPDGLDPMGQVYVLNQVGYLLTALKGYAFPDLESVYKVAEPISSQITNVDALFQVKYGLWRFHSGRGNLQKSIGIGEELLELANHADYSGFAIVAHRALATSLYRQARFAESLEHARSGMPVVLPPFPAFLGDDPAINCECFASMSLWHLGFLEQANVLQTQALEHARNRASAHGLAVAFYLAAYLYDFLREYAKSQVIAEEMVELSSEYGFRWWLAAGLIRRGWSTAMLGDPSKGIQDIDQGMNLWRSSGAVIGFPYWNSLLAQAYMQQSNYPEASQCIADGFAAMRETTERWWEPELYRLKAEILLQQGIGEQEAIGSLMTSLELSKAAGDKSLALRTSLLLSDYWRRVGKTDAAHSVLRDAMNQFSEGFESIDLMQAAELEKTFA